MARPRELVRPSCAKSGKKPRLVGALVLLSYLPMLGGHVIPSLGRGSEPPSCLIVHRACSSEINRFSSCRVYSSTVSVRACKFCCLHYDLR